MINELSEQELIENAAIELFRNLKYNHQNCFHEKFGDGATFGRETSHDVVLVPKLIEAIRALNKNISEGAITLAVQEIVKDRSVLSMEAANREIHKLLKEGILVKEKLYDGSFEDRRVTIIDFDKPKENDYFLAQQFWVTGDLYKRRADLVGFINGLPLIFIELKAIHEDLKKAYDNNLSDYKETIPQLLWYNAFIILSNGSESRTGTISADWDHFNKWKKINHEGEKGVVSLDTIIMGVCEPNRFLDILENFIIFQDISGSLIKIVAKNHQYLGVNHAIESFKRREENKGQLGVFWHTQGSGKSFSMIFFSQKILRKFPGNFTFVIVTDRRELDKQIYKNFESCGAVTEEEVHAESSAHLRQLLRENHRNIFTLIHKFRTENGKPHPVLSDRSDIIVITDESHRTQYDTLALNMRTALPNANFIAFTGTPLIVGEELTRKTFGDYVSVYNFKQSIDDKATVPLYYEKRKPELQLINEQLFNEKMYKIIENVDLDEDQEKRLERELGRQYHLITREERLEKVAADLVNHFINRGYQGKAMVVSIDKPTAVKMYDKVQFYWEEEIKYLKRELENKVELVGGEDPFVESLQAKIQYMENTDMAVVVSSEQNELKRFKDLGLEIRKHRERIVREDLDTKFKDPDDPFRIVFVCAMWMTGFDAPCVSTIYLDKPMKNHTLMQTIARANRVFGEKDNGTIVDYIGVFHNLQKALAIYGPTPGGKKLESDDPIKAKKELVKKLKKAIHDAIGFLKSKDVDIETILSSDKLNMIKLIVDAVDKILINDESKKEFLGHESFIRRIYKGILPDPELKPFSKYYHLFKVLAAKIRSLTGPIDISDVMRDIENLLDESIGVEGYKIFERKEIDLSEVDFEALRKKFLTEKKRIEIERVKNAIRQKVNQLTKWNKKRIDFLAIFQRLLTEYNSGTINIDEFFNELIKFANQLKEEEQRAVKENLSEEELAIFDLLDKNDLNEKEKKQVKLSAKNLLETLTREKLVLDWRKKQQTQAAVMLAIQTILDKHLPRAYSEKVLLEKRDLIFQHIYESYFGSGRSVYE